MNSAVHTANPTPVVRDADALRRNLIGSAVCTAIAIGGPLLVDHWTILILSLVTGLGAVGAMIGVFRASWKADCPACGETIEELAGGRNRPTVCRACDRFVEGDNGRLWAVDPNAVFQEPLLFAMRPERFAFPNACCVCGVPPTRGETIREEVTHGATAVTLVAGVTMHNNITIEGVPHCDEHSAGISVEDNKYLHFRSYPYLRAFCRLNRIRPGEPPASLTSLMQTSDLIDCLTGNGADMRRDAAIALGYRGVTALRTGSMLSLVAQNDANESVRKEADRTLRILTGPEAHDEKSPRKTDQPTLETIALCDEDFAAV